MVYVIVSVIVRGFLVFLVHNLNEMDHMLASPFNLPSIGTPVHQPEEDQQILPIAQQQQQSLPPLQMPPLLPIQNSISQKPHTYAPSLGGYSTPQSMMHPQTPVSTYVSKLSQS